MKNLHRVAFVLLLLGGALIGQAQTVNDSLAIVSAQWEVKTIGKGIVSRCAAFQELYHGPQYVSIIEVNPTYTIVQMHGVTEDIVSLYRALDTFGCVLQYTRSGRIAVTRGMQEQVSAFLEERENG